MTTPSHATATTPRRRRTTAPKALTARAMRSQRGPPPEVAEVEAALQAAAEATHAAGLADPRGLGRRFGQATFHDVPVHTAGHPHIQLARLDLIVSTSGRVTAGWLPAVASALRQEGLVTAKDVLNRPAILAQSPEARYRLAAAARWAQSVAAAVQRVPWSSLTSRALGALAQPVVVAPFTVYNPAHVTALGGWLTWGTSHVRHSSLRRDLSFACPTTLYPWAPAVLALGDEDDEALARRLVEAALAKGFVMQDAALTAGLPDDLAAAIVAGWLRGQAR